MVCDPSGRPTKVEKKIAIPGDIEVLRANMTIKVTLIGQDVEYWGGNFGTRFSAEKLSF